MPDIERQAVVDIVVNKDKAEQQYSDFIKKIEEPVKLEIDADVRDAVAAIKELQNMFKALTNQAKDGEKLRINVQGMAKLQQQLAQVDDTLSTLSNHFTGLRRSVDIQAELNDNQRALQSYQNSFKGVVDQINKLKTKRTTDNFFNMQKTKTNINDILSGASFKQVYEDSQQNVSRLLVEIAKAAQETDGLAKTIQLSETQSVSLADIFKAITTSIEASGKSLSDLKIEGLSADIIDVLKNIQKLESEIPTLQAKFDDAVNREKAGSINVQIDAKSIESLSDAISELKGVFKVEDGSTIGFKEEDIDRITSSFSELQTVLENIHNLLSSFDLPKIKAPEIETGEEKPRRESRSTTTVSTTMPTINGGTRTVTNTSDSSTSTGGVSGVEAAVDGQNRLQQELRETRQEAESTQDVLQEVGKQESVSSQPKQDNRTLEEKLALLKEIKSEYKFLETADEKRMDMEEKAWDAGGNNPKSEADSQKKINTYNELCEHIEKAEAKVNEFEAEFSKVIIHLKNGEKIELNDFVDLSDTSLDKRKIKNIQFFPNFEGYIQDAYDDMRKMDDWIDENVNGQMNPPSVWTADNQEEIESAIQKLTEFRDRAKQIMSHEGFSELSQSMQEEVRTIVTYFDNLIKTEQRLLDVQKQFDRANAESPISSGGNIGDQIADGMRNARDEAEKTTDAIEDVVYHAGDLSDLQKSSKTHPLGIIGEGNHTPHTNSLTGLYTTEDLDGFWANEWSGAPISSIDISKYKLFVANTEESAKALAQFFGHMANVSSGMQLKEGSYSEFEPNKLSIDELYEEFQNVFKNTTMSIEQFSDFIENTRKILSENDFSFEKLEMSARDEGGYKQGLEQIRKNLPKEIFNSDSFQTQLLKMLGYEGVDLRGTSFGGTYTGGTVLFDVKPESIVKTNEKWSDVMSRAGYEISDEDLKLEEERSRLAKESAKSYEELYDAQNKLNDAKYDSMEQETKPPSTAMSESFQREASAAAEDREEIEKLNNEKRESPEPQSDSAEIEKQGEAYREATADAEKFAEAKRETSGETPSSTAVSESFQREAEAVREAMTVEEQALDELKQKLIGEIPNAVDTKTQAFRSEQVEVSDLIDLEIGKVEELAKVLQSLFKGDSDSGVMSGLKDLFDSINKVKINKDTVQNLTDASWAIDTIGESFKKLSNEGLDSSAFDSLNDLLKKGEELKSLAKILDASEKKIATAGKAAGAGTTGKTTANPTKDATAEYKELLETIQAATKAKTELNKIETKQVNGKTVDAQLADATSKSTGASKAAADAMARIDEMYKDGVISVEQYTAAQKALQDSLKGTAESVDALAHAQEKAQNKQIAKNIKDQVDAQKRELKEYENLYKNRSIGQGLNPDDAKRMENLVSSITDRQKQWNEEIKNGNVLYKEMTNGIETVADVNARINKTATSQMTKGLNKELEKMEKQASWRPDAWKDNIYNFKQMIASFNDDIKSGLDFDELYKKYNNYITKAKADMKNTDFLPIKETWQSSFTAKIETWANQNKIAAKEFGEQLKTLKGQIAAVDNEAEASRLENIFSGIQSDAASKNLLGKSLGDRFKDQFKNTMTSLATYYLSFQDFIRYGREAISVVTELDTQLTEMRKVSNESLQTLQQYQLESFDIADRVGTTASQIQSSTADWLRLGKNLPEAANMAEISTKLLNVSEFTDIKDATDALVSATQAYTDVTASDIVDKLNLIGNNFAVSTDELAQGLQNAGAVLKTQGNDLDQTLALLTAGNLIGQDMSKASAGIRTIALRISGTEEAKNEIADMGEDVDDFVVRTRSKTDQIIRDYTAVASNMYKGVSVLDPNGNLRDTYDILLDISKIYSEIQAEDKQRGTNRAQALVEQLAGIILPDKYRNIFLRTHLNALIT